MRAPLHESGAARLPVQIDSGNGRVRTIDGILDTGSSLCHIPQVVASEMGLAQKAWFSVGSIHRETKEPGYYLRLVLPDLFEGTVAMVEMKPDYDFVVVGRSVLKTLKFVFDGRRGEFELGKE
jgi:predicted aspartyl protease